MKRLAGWNVATIRVFKNGEPAVAAAATDALGIAWPQSHGAWSGSDPWMIWRSPVERIVLSSSQQSLQTLLANLRPGRMDAGCAVDLAEAIAVWHLEGSALAGVMTRLADALALPAPGNATRLRWADVSVILMRLSQSEALLLADATLEPYLDDWWAYACDAL
ncbi:hypothetical protein [Noviherbaspirillum sp.]|uniref:hypothetical protein n=1 Tax=Noviherbaspirillum sp. TaxID=1926288 RepID=UPI002B481194|nr:hypothetical protein [Noviherbaspirillum sp.]